MSSTQRALTDTSGVAADELFPTGLITSAKIHDIDELSARATKWKSEYRQLEAGRLNGVMSLFHTGAMQMAFTRYSRGFTISGEIPPGCRTCGVELTISQPALFRGRDVGKLDVMTADHHSGLEFVSRAPEARRLVISVEERMLMQTARDVWGTSTRQHLIGDRLKFVDWKSRNSFIHLCRELKTSVLEHREILCDAKASKALEVRIVEALLNAAAPEFPVPVPFERHRLARRAYLYMMDNASHSLTVRELCGAVNASERTLELGFLEIYGMAPRAYLKSLRLSNARRALLNPSANTTVTKVAMDWFFFHLGRFSIEYRLRFGERPLDTLQRSRNYGVAVSRM